MQVTGAEPPGEQAGLDAMVLKVLVVVLSLKVVMPTGLLRLRSPHHKDFPMQLPV